MGSIKPLGRKSYGSIPHLSGSRRGSDKRIHLGQEKILLEQKRDRHDVIFVEEKLDGTNASVCKVNGRIIPLTRSGYKAIKSEFKTYHTFDKYVMSYTVIFNEILKEGWRIVGEWMYYAVGTKYELPHLPFVPFDIFNQDNKRISKLEVRAICDHYDLPMPKLLWVGDSLPLQKAIDILGQGWHGGEPEGVVYRCERKGEHDFMAKWVNPDKVDGIYMNDEILNNYDKPT